MQVLMQKYQLNLYILFFILYSLKLPMQKIGLNFHSNTKNVLNGYDPFYQSQRDIQEQNLFRNREQQNYQMRANQAYLTSQSQNLTSRYLRNQISEKSKESKHNDCKNSVFQCRKMVCQQIRITKQLLPNNQSLKLDQELKKLQERTQCQNAIKQKPSNFVRLTIKSLIQLYSNQGNDKLNISARKVINKHHSKQEYKKIDLNILLQDDYFIQEIRIKQNLLEFMKQRINENVLEKNKKSYIKAAEKFDKFIHKLKYQNFSEQLQECFKQKKKSKNLNKSNKKKNRKTRANFKKINQNQKNSQIIDTNEQLRVPKESNNIETSVKSISYSDTLQMFEQDGNFKQKSLFQQFLEDYDTPRWRSRQNNPIICQTNEDDPYLSTFDSYVNSASNNHKMNSFESDKYFDYQKSYVIQQSCLFDQTNNLLPDQDNRLQRIGYTFEIE